MTGCSAPNCSNHSRKGFKFYRFPADLQRRKQWLVNCKRINWIPTPNDRLCSEHFEASQIEQNRLDGKKRLRHNAIPTIFKKPNLLKQLDLKRPLENTYCENIIIEVAHSSKKQKKLIHHSQDPLDVANIKKEEFTNNDGTLALKEKVIKLENDLKLMKAAVGSFISDEQLEKLITGRKMFKKWSNEEIRKGFKIRFGLGKNGYNFLRDTGYPTPSYSILNNRISGMVKSFGLFESVLNFLAKKVESMTEIQRDCSLIVDKMEISGQLDLDKSTKSFVGQVTLGDKNIAGNHLTTVLLHGLNSSWKQIIACHITEISTSGPDMKDFIRNVIQSCTVMGLNVLNVTSDMGSNNKVLWASLGISITPDERIFSFNCSDRKINLQVDAPHLLNNWKNALRSSIIYLPAEVVNRENLPTNIVNAVHIKNLWNKEINNDKALRSLHHLSADIMNSTKFSKMLVESAMPYISLETALALEAAVLRKDLPSEALSLAWFIRLLRQWFDLVNSRTLAESVTLNNYDEKEDFLNNFITIIEGTLIGKGWKPLNSASILTSLSFLDTAKYCLRNDYKFVLGSRLSQDALENVFSQIRQKYGEKPSALDCLKAMKQICVSQYMSDIENTDNDHNLLDDSQIDT